MDELLLHPKSCGIELDYDEDNKRFYLGDKYAKTAVFDRTNQGEISGKMFREVASFYYYDSKGWNLTEKERNEALDTDYLLAKYNQDHYDLILTLSNIESLMYLLEVVDDFCDQDLFLAELTTPISTSNEVQQLPTKGIDFFIVLYLLGRLGVVQTFIANGSEGCSTNDNKAKIKAAAEWAFGNWGKNGIKIATLQDYAKKNLIEKNHRDKFEPAISFLKNYYPKRETEMKEIWSEFMPNESKG